MALINRPRKGALNFYHMNMEQLIETLIMVQSDLNQAKDELQEVLYSEFATQELTDEMDGLLEEIAQIDARIDYLRDLND